MNLNYNSGGIGTNNFPSYKRASIIIVPHLDFDDELFQFGSYLTEYPNKIILVFTHPTDTVSRDKFSKQLEMLRDCISRIEEYRTNRGFIEPELDLYVCTDAKNKGIPEEFYLSTVSLIENIIRSVKFIDTYGFTIESSHQSHTESNKIASHILRSPFLEKIKCVLNAPYPQTYFSPCLHRDSDGVYNTFQPMTEDSAKLLHELIGKVYGEKNPPTGILGADAFLISLQYYGLACSYKYAQPFIAKRLVFQLEERLLNG